CNFGRAAANLGVPKSTVSRQVAELERSLGLRLLSRTTRRVQLTEAGHLYFERCQRIVAEAQVAHEELQKLVETPSGPLRVNMPADFGTDFLAEAFMEFSQRYPEVTFYLDLASPEHAGRVFQTCDVSIEIGALPDSTQIARLLGWLPAYLYASPEYLARHGPAPPRVPGVPRIGRPRHPLAAGARRRARGDHARQAVLGEQRGHGAQPGFAGRRHRRAGAGAKRAPGRGATPPAARAAGL